MLHTNTRRRLEECYALLRKQMRTATRTASNHGDSQWEDAMREGGRIRPRPAWQRKLREIHLLLSLTPFPLLPLLHRSPLPSPSLPISQSIACNLQSSSPPSLPPSVIDSSHACSPLSLFPSPEVETVLRPRHWATSSRVQHETPEKSGNRIERPFSVRSWTENGSSNL